MMLIMFFILWFILHKTPLGRKTYAVGGNEKVSFIAGIKINRIKIFAYTVTGFLCGMAGAILTSRLNSAQPTAGTGYHYRCADYRHSEQWSEYLKRIQLLPTSCQRYSNFAGCADGQKEKLSVMRT